MRSTGADVILRSSAEPSLLMKGFNALSHTTKFNLLQVDGVSWSMAETTGQHARPQALDSIDPADVVPATQAAESTFADRAANLTSALYSGSVFAFKTREGATGLLEVTAANRGMKIRYKLVEQAAKQ